VDEGASDVLLRGEPWATEDDALRWTRTAVAVLTDPSAAADRARLTGAIQMLRDAIAATPENSADLAGRLSNLSGALQLAYARFGMADYLDESVTQGRKALALTAPGDPHSASHASNLAAALRLRFEVSSNLSDLEEGIAAGRLAVTGSEATSQRLPGRLSNLCNALRTHWERTSDRRSLRDAIDFGWRAAELAGSGHPQRASVLSNLGSALHARYGVTGELDDLLGAVSAGEECLALTSADDDDAAGRLSNVGLTLRDLYTQTSEPAHLDRAVALARRAVECCSQERNVAAVLSGLSGSLLMRFEAADTMADLVEGIDTAREALAAAPVGYPARAAALLNLSNAVQVQAETMGESGTVDEAITLAEEAISCIPADHPHQGALHNGLAVALRLRFEESGRSADVDRAVLAGHTAVALLRLTRPDSSVARALANWSAALQARYEYSGRQPDLDEAVRHAREAVQLTGETAPERARQASTLVNALRLRFESTDDPIVLDEAVAVAQVAVDGTPLPGAQRAPRLINLSVVLRARAELGLSRADADAAVEQAREVRALLDPAHPLRVAATADLALALQTRYEIEGRAEDLDEAVGYGWEAVDHTRSGHPDRARYLSNHGATLHSRFELTGASADLDAAIEALRESVDATAAGDIRRAGRYSNLSSVLRERFALLGERENAAESVTAARAAVASAPAGHPDRASYLTKLALALTAAPDGAGDAAVSGAVAEDSMEEARLVLAEAVAATPRTSPTYLDRLSNQAGLLLRLFDRMGSEEHLNAAVSLVQRVVDAAPAEHPGLVAYWSNLGRARYTRFERTGEDSDREAAEHAFRDAARRVTAPPATRAAVARGWAAAAAAASDWPTAVEAGALAIQMLAQTIDRGLVRPDQERRLTPGQGTASMVAACCAQAGELARAVELLDQGRGVLIGQALDMRSDVKELAENDEKLAVRFADIINRLDAPLENGFDHAEPRRNARTWALVQERRRAVAAEFEAVIADIRRRRGFERFLLAPELAQLQEAATAGPVVAINVHGIRSDALIVTPAGVTKVELPALTPAAVNQQALKLLAAVETATDPDESASERLEAETAITEVLAWLWDHVAEAVLDRLDEDGLWEQYTHSRRLWWCPTGALAYLPLHAAGRPGVHGSVCELPCSVMGRVISSYTPTLRALLDARQPLVPPRTRPPEIAVVTMPTTPGESALRNAAREGEAIAEAFPRRVQRLTGPDALRDRVLAALADRSWAHLACHGVTDLEQPSESALLVHDHLSAPLTVSDIARLRLRRAELAYLSACTTARPGVRLLDESIHLASAFQVAGYRHVVATMWPVQDIGALRIARSVYAMLGRSGSPADSAQALHTAILGARSRAPRRPSTWASFVHYGA
jgi:tetratricopeptide (TPR) repeat protein